MKIAGLAIAAAAALGVVGAAPAVAQPRHPEATQPRKVVAQRNANNGRHNGWQMKKVRVCRDTWRDQRRQRVCNWRYR